MSETISVADLERLGACASQVERFRETFDEAEEGVAVTMANMLVAQDAELYLPWMARHAFTNRARLFYNRVLDLAREERERVRDSATAEYKHVKTLREEAPLVNIDLAWRECQRIIDRAIEERKRILAMAWVAAYEASAVENRKGDE